MKIIENLIKEGSWIISYSLVSSPPFIAWPVY